MHGLSVASERIIELLGEAPALEELGSGFRSSEGPVWIAERGELLFSDVAADARRRWEPVGGVSLVAQPTAKRNGMTRDREGRLVVCEHVTRSVVRMDASGTGAGRAVLASRYEGRELNSPNDVVVASDGAVLFTDQLGGRTDEFGRAGEPELDFTGVFRVAPEGGLELLGRFEAPNGLCFSPDESLLYVNESAPGRIQVFDYAPGRPLGEGRVFAEGLKADNGNVDGMKCDRGGNVWVTGPGGIWILDPEGSHLGVLELPERALNLHWGGSGWSRLFITARTRLFAVETRTAGRREPFMH